MTTFTKIICVTLFNYFLLHSAFAEPDEPGELVPETAAIETSQKTGSTDLKSNQNSPTTANKTSSEDTDTTTAPPKTLNNASAYSEKTPDTPAGALVIAGGALRASNTAVYQRFIELAGGAEKAKIAVIPAASSKPQRNARKFLDDMEKLGVTPENTRIIPIAIKDDSDTSKVNESRWADNAKDEKLAEELMEFSGVWLIGGDQMRLRATLLDKDGTLTAVAQSLHNIFNTGGVIGGTSAGSAVMSEVIIASGGSFVALSEGLAEEYDDSSEKEYDLLVLDKGLGLFSHGIIDQHFDRKSRVGRLIRATYQHRDSQPMGFGVEENTALIIKGEQAEVVGSGGVHVIDVSQAEKTSNQGFKNVRLSFFQSGDQWHFGEGLVNAAEKYPTTDGSEYFNTPNPVVTGVFNRNTQIKHLIGYDLIDNAAATQVLSYAFDPQNGSGFELLFSQDENTKGYWKALDGQMDSYAYSQVRLDINPIKISIEKIPEIVETADLESDPNETVDSEAQATQ